MTDYPRLRLGHYLDKPDTPVEVSAPDIAHHTAILAQSGAGKSFLLGRLVEEILLKTRANVLVIDSNGDFRSAHDVDDHAWPTEDELTTKRWPPGKEHAVYLTADVFREAWAERVHMVHQREKPTIALSTPVVHWHRPLVSWGSLSLGEQVAVLGWTTSANVTEMQIYGQWVSYCVSKRPDLLHTPLPPELAQFMENAGKPLGWDRQTWEQAKLRVIMGLSEVGSWGIWGTRPDGEASQHAVEDEERTYDLQVLDMPSLGNRDARLAVASAVLAENWKRAVEQWESAAHHPSDVDTRTPLFVVIDEAHSFVPDKQGTPREEQLAESIHRIAAEGRKYGLFLILATQRPAKVRPGLLAECENVCLLRLQSPVDHETASKTWGIPKEYVARTAHFGKGDGLLSGRWVPSATFFHAAYRRTKEGGASLNPEHWAQPREPRAAEDEDNG